MAMAEASVNEIPHSVEDQSDIGATGEEHKSSSRGEALPASVAGRISKAQELKEEGNVFFKEQKWKKAIRKYHHAVMYVKGVTDKFDLLPGLERAGGRLVPSEEETKRANELMVATSNNLAACLMKTEEWDKVVKHANKVIELQPENAKALYRRGVANLNNGNLEAASEDLRKAEKLNPKDLGIKKQLQAIQQREADYKKSEQKMYSAMFKS